ncbi:MAG: hypothetical protein HOP11_08225, partial [Saprospiraceae bacterium]|nr:hypothetical protein [Saprospiraceae bacterium]
MAKRFVDTELWDKEWFMKLSPKLKCLVKFVRDKCDLAGIWSINMSAASFNIGEEVTESELLKIDNGKQFFKFDEGKIFVIGFINFQYGDNLNVASPVHRKILSILYKNEIDYKDLSNRVSNTLSNSLFNRLKEEDKDKDKEEDKETDKEKDSESKNFKIEKPKRVPSTTYDKFTQAWFDWHKSEFKFEPKFAGRE